MLKVAYRFMRYDMPKTTGALLGVIIANFLIGQQTGIFTFLTNAMSALVDNTPTDLWVVDENTTNVNALGQIDKRIGYQLESIPGIEKAYPLLISGAVAKFKNGQTYGIQLIGSQLPDMVGGPWNVMIGNRVRLVEEGAVTTDYFDRKNLGYAKLGDEFEVNGKKLFIAAQTKGARGFGAVYVFTTLERARAITKTPYNKVSAYLLKLKPGQNPHIIKNHINQSYSGVRAWLPKELSRATKATILSSTGIAISTGTLVVFAIISGMVIIGLTLYSAAVDRFKDYATMKAIGAKNRYIAGLILLQAFILATLGYIIASFLLEFFRRGIANTGAIFFYTTEMRLIFYSITLLIASIGSYFAIRRITKLEPATVFRM